MSAPHNASRQLQPPQSSKTHPFNRPVRNLYLVFHPSEHSEREQADEQTQHAAQQHGG